MTAIDHYARYQSGLTMAALYPYRTDKICRCGCGRPLPKRKRVWASKDCERRAVQHFQILKGDMAVIRAALLERDHGVCACCDKDCTWEAHHKAPVSEGGGGCDLEGYETRCTECHSMSHGSRPTANRERMPESASLLEVFPEPVSTTAS